MFRLGKEPMKPTNGSVSYCFGSLHAAVPSEYVAVYICTISGPLVMSMSINL